MQYRITGRHIEIGDALRTHVEDALGAVVGKYAERPTEATVVFGRDGHAHACEVSVHLSTGLTVQARSREEGIYAACDQACDRIGKQLRRYKRRLKNHHRERSSPVEYSGAPSYILAGEGEDREAEEPESLQPVIVAELETRIPYLSVGEAVMQMELNAAPLLVFRNESHNGVNVVYRRDDGNVGWIDPRATEEKGG